MNLYAIQVPAPVGIFDNAATRFGNFIRAEAGGYSVREASGVWWDDKTATEHRDEMLEYHVMCSQELMWDIQAKAFELWPNEICFFVAQIGQASIVYPNVKTGAQA